MSNAFSNLEFTVMSLKRDMRDDPNRPARDLAYLKTSNIVSSQFFDWYLEMAYAEYDTRSLKYLISEVGRSPLVYLRVELVTFLMFVFLRSLDPDELAVYASLNNFEVAGGTRP
jgi:hypothetical protein